MGLVFATGAQKLPPDPGSGGGLVQEADPREVRLPPVLHAGSDQQEEGRGSRSTNSQKIVIMLMITKRSSLESSNKKQNKFDDLCLPKL